MSFARSPAILTAVLCILLGIHGQGDWGVTYSSTSICGLKGSFVDILCTYSYPSGHQIIDTFWHIKWETGTKDKDDFSLDPRYQGRVKYLGDEVNNCTLQIKDLRDSDTVEKYRFRFITDDSKGKWSGHEVSLTLTGLELLIDPATVTEGGKVTLTCSTTCSLSNNPTYIWYRNLQLLGNSHTTNNRLVIDSARPEDTGRYSCAVQGHEILNSSDRTLEVRYSPRMTSASLNLSGDIQEGDSVTLTCSSDANPPVHNYTWYRRKHGSEPAWIGQGQTYSITNISAEHSGLYYCRAENKHGANTSNATCLDVHYSDFHSGIQFIALGASSAVVLLLVVVASFWRQKTNSTKTPKSNTSKEVSNPVYYNTSMGCGSGQIAGADCDDEDGDVKYASVQFTPNKQQDVLSQEEDIQYASVQFKSNKQQDVLSQEEDIQYASVQFTPNKQQEVLSQDEDVQYANVPFRKSKPEPNVPEPPLSGTSQEETQYTSVNLQGLSAAPQTGVESVIYSAINTHSKP
ncbi:B-cell receptor CD22-like [Alosa sapidissima]|uniref:B-cell receptor CD22-like n=1 Tax=Alosa sapidissima TaxID=34773 RepID=UPI001C093957|nr:B-cell receptor CD22-like [Alosa sapidissima]